MLYRASFSASQSTSSSRVLLDLGCPLFLVCPGDNAYIIFRFGLYGARGGKPEKKNQEDFGEFYFVYISLQHNVSTSYTIIISV